MENTPVQIKSLNTII